MGDDAADDGSWWASFSHLRCVLESEHLAIFKIARRPSRHSGKGQKFIDNSRICRYVGELMELAVSRLKPLGRVAFGVRHPGSWYKTICVEVLSFGTAKRADLASQPRGSLNVVVYEMLGDRKGCPALIRAGQNGMLQTRVFDG